MSTSKYFDIIGVLAIVVALAAVVCAAVFWQSDPAKADDGVEMDYADTLFDNSVVHTMDIQVDDWQGFLDTCENEEYTSCNVVIDGEEVQVVGLRAKGNTSLSTVSSLGSDRYSFKMEFDQYVEGGNYHGLDKLSLNNLIQDSTYMKDYLTYTLMGEFGVDAPLCSYVNITVNGEDWGLYLAVEGVEDSFLQRNYGSDFGNLYKPDSMSFGGGRGNGERFDMDDFRNDDGYFDFADKPDRGSSGASAPSDAGSSSASSADSADGSGSSASAGMPEGFDPSSLPEGFDASSLPDNFDPSNMPEGFSGGSMPSMPSGSSSGSMPEGFSGSSMPSMPSGNSFGPGDMPSGSSPGPGGNSAGPGGMPGGGGGGFGMGSDDVKLQYIDDNPDSYSNIFDSAKTDVSAADKNRLIRSLKNIGEGADLENSVDIDQVIRYFVVHNYVCNSDSYTGTMTHNYYLYEDDGQLSLIPWDYNLAFGTFMAGDATGSVNDAIDSPLQTTGDGGLPMFDFIVSDEQYRSLYHEYFAEFLAEVDVQGLIDRTEALIAPYVEKDATAFYSYEEHEEGVAILKQFCALRTESVEAQLDGTIPTTDSERTDDTQLVDASGLDLSVMGSMGGAGGGGGGGFPGSPGGNRPPGR